jgi:methyl-accepting chemotaxis protein
MYPMRAWRNRKIRSKILLPMCLGVLSVISVMGGIGVSIRNSEQESAGKLRYDYISRLYDIALEGRSAEMERAANIVISTDEVVAYLEGDRSSQNVNMILDGLFLSIGENMGLRRYALYTPDKQCIYQYGEQGAPRLPAQLDPALAEPFAKTAEEYDYRTFFRTVKNGGAVDLEHCMVTVVTNDDDDVVGYVEVASRPEVCAAGIHQRIGSPNAFLSPGAKGFTGISDPDLFTGVATTLTPASHDQASTAVQTLGASYLADKIPHHAPDGSFLGYLWIVNDDTINVQKQNRALLVGGCFTAAAIFFALGMAFFTSRRITKPLNMALVMADQVAGGDLSHRLGSSSGDELGELSRALDRMSAGLQEKADLADSIAKGDLTHDVVPASDRDAFGNALKTMNHQLNEVLSGISQAAEQVNAGSREIADSSTTLSQGATEQAASMQEISASMTELSGQVKTNAENADQADELSKVALETASIGVERMASMTGAMDEINASSEEISKIIKVIDDIAFQTNLLALNAAVEAARAGQHGKGFAVVAEEVRNLAGRSAKAARETATLIEGSLGKVKNGTRISKETAESLASIVESIGRASDFVEEIASASNEQSRGITEVSDGLAQIDSVTQQNTANSEETASATEELSSQAATLQHLVTKFQLKDSAAAPGRGQPQPQTRLESADRRPAQEAPAGISGDSAKEGSRNEPSSNEVIELTTGWGD